MTTNNGLNAPLPLKPSKGGSGVANSDSFTMTYGGNVSIGGALTTSASTVNIRGALSTQTNAVTIGGSFTTSSSAVNIQGALTTSTGAVSLGGAYTTLNSHNWIGNFAFQATLTAPTNISFPTTGTILSTSTGLVTANALSEIALAGLQSSARTNISAQASNAYLDQLAASEVNIGNSCIINGQFQNWQRGTSFSAVADGTITADRWSYAKSGVGVVTISQDTSNLPGVAIAGINTAAVLKVLVTTVDNSGSTTRCYSINQVIEGNVYAPISGKPTVIDFDVYASVAGTYSVVCFDSGSTASIVSTYTINSANTWEHKTIFLPPPSVGTFPLTNAASFRMRWILASGAGGGSTTTTSVWQAGNFFQGNGSAQANLFSTLNNVFEIANVNFTNGSTRQPYGIRPFDVEFRLCQRYYQLIQPTHFIGTSTTNALTQVALPVVMRGTPTLTAISTLSMYNGSTTFSQSTSGVANSGGTTALSMQCDCTNFVGLTAGQAYVRNAQNQFIALNAEIS